MRVTDFGIVDQAQAAYALLPRLQAADLDLVFCDMLTYATSATFGVLVRNLDVPIVLVALQPLQALDYARASTYMQLANDDFCSVPEFTGVALRMGKQPPPVILGHLDDDAEAEAELGDWCDIACVLARPEAGPDRPLRPRAGEHARHADRSDRAHGGLRLPHRPDRARRSAATAADGDRPTRSPRRKRQILEMFDTPDPKSDPITRKLTDEDLHVAARVAVALDKFVDEKQLDGLAYYYEAEEGSPMRELVTNLIVGNSLLTAAGFPMCGESDLKTCIAMLIMDRLDIGGSFAEFHPIDFQEGFVLVGHDGPHHVNIAEGKPVLRSLVKYHGKPGKGASVEFKIKEGPITMLSIGLTRPADGSSSSSPRGKASAARFRPRATRTRAAFSSPTCGPSSAAGWPRVRRITLPWASAIAPNPCGGSPRPWEFPVPW